MYRHFVLLGSFERFLKAVQELDDDKDKIISPTTQQSESTMPAPLQKGLLEKARQLWGGDQSKAFKLSAWAFAGTVALATSLPTEYYEKFYTKKSCESISTDYRK